MSKTNFTKVEEALAAGLRQMTVSQLIEMADAVNTNGEESSIKTPKLATIQKTLLTIIQHNVNRLHKKDPTIYKKIGISHKELKKLLETSNELTPENWEEVKKIKEKIDVYMEESLKGAPEASDEQIIEKERIKHINKRFNVNEKWLPLQ